MPSLRLGIMATLVYVAIIGFANAYLIDPIDAVASVNLVLVQILFVQLLAVVFCVGFILRYLNWRNVGFGRTNWAALIWFVPAWLVLILMGTAIFEALTWQDISALGRFGLAILVVTTFLIAFGEEVIFRGVVLRGAAARLALPFAMFLSAFSFGFFHLVNRLIGQDMSDTYQQIVFALLVGFFLAPLAVRIGNLWPLIIWHWLWNIVVILGQIAGVLYPFALIGIAFQAVVSIWLWTDIIRKARIV